LELLVCNFPRLSGLFSNGEYWVGIIGCITAVMLQWFLADLLQKPISSFFGYPGIAVTHLMALSGAIVAIH